MPHTAPRVSRRRRISAKNSVGTGGLPAGSCNVPSKSKERIRPGCGQASKVLTWGGCGGGFHPPSPNENTAGRMQSAATARLIPRRIRSNQGARTDIAAHVTDERIKPDIVVRHWHRHWIHWIGLVGLLFLLWVWFGSLRMDAGVSYGTRAATYCLGIGGGRVDVLVFRHKHYSGLEGSPELGFECWKDPFEHEIEASIFAPALITFHEDQFISIMTGARVGLWLILQIYILIWLALILSWRRRLLRCLAVPSVPSVPLNE